MELENRSRYSSSSSENNRDNLFNRKYNNQVLYSVLGQEQIDYNRVNSDADTISEEVKPIDDGPECLFNEFKSEIAVQKFYEIFKTKIKSHLNTKPKQEIKSFLSNFENLLKQQKDKFLKQTKIDLAEDNYDQFAVYVMREMYYDKIFRCQLFEYVMEQQFNTIEEIKDSLIVKNGSELNKEEIKKI